MAEWTHSSAILTLAPDRGAWSASHPNLFTPSDDTPDSHWTEGWVGSRTGLDTMEKRKILALPGTETRPSSPSPY
jgi:hypothetical protein